MKGTLQKNEYNVWVVRYRETTPLSITTETLPLHPDFIEMMDTCFTSKFTHEIEFEIVTEWENGEVGVNGLTYAKLIHHPVDTNKMINHVPDVGKMVFPKDINGVVVKVGDKVQGIGSLKFHDEFEIDRTPIVTANIQNGKLYFGNLSAESFTLGFKIVESKMVEDDAAPIDWLINQLENHIVLSAHGKLGTNRTGDYRIGLRKAIDFCHQAKEMEAKETLYTEEQMMGYAEWIFNLDTHTVLTMPKEALLQEFISQSIKQGGK